MSRSIAIALTLAITGVGLVHAKPAYAAASYQDTVLADAPTYYFRLNETSGTTAIDSSGNGNHGTYSASVTKGVSGAASTSPDNAIRMNAATADMVSTSVLRAGSNNLTESVWFRTTSTAGGRLVGFGNMATAQSTSFDRDIYLTPDGTAHFLVYNGTTHVISSGIPLNDGLWHNLTATLGASGITLSVDGTRVAGNSAVTTGESFNGYYRIGWDTTSGRAPVALGNIAADIDEVAIWHNTVLSAAQIRNHVIASGNNVAPAGLPPATDSYGATVLSQKPDTFYRFDETSGAAQNSSPNNTSASLNGGVVQGVAGLPTLGTKAVSLNSNSYVTNPQNVYMGGNFSLSVWFKTNTTQGGRIIGAGSSIGTNSSSYDRHVWMSNDGKIHFGVYPGARKTVSASASYNDNQWHLVTATMSSTAGMSLYIDGALVSRDSTVSSPTFYFGYWDVGRDNISGWSPVPTNLGLVGEIDEVAIWNSRTLSATEIATQYTAAGFGAPTVAVSVDPSLTFTVTSHTGACNGASQSVGSNGSASAISLGRINAASNAVVAQDLVVSSNTSQGFAVRLKSDSPIVTSNARVLAPVSGTNAAPGAFPAPGVEAFGYTTSEAAFTTGSATRFTSGGPWWAALSGTGDLVSVASGSPVNNDTVCVAFQAGVSSLTPAGTYAGSILYTAVPIF